MSTVSPVVIITGAAAGIGRATARAFAQAGYRIVAADNQTEAGPALIAELRASGAEAVFVAADQALEADGARVVQVALDTFGRLDAAVNNAGVEGVEHRIEDQDPAALRRTLAVNLEGVLWAMKHEIPALRRSGGGAIVNLGSISWQSKNDGFPCYTLAKSSVNGLTRGLARTLGRERIRINTVTPGWVMTERQMALWLDEAGEAEIERQQCLPDKLMPHDVAAMVLFLASDDAQMCTAQEFVVDAGWV